MTIPSVPVRAERVPRRIAMGARVDCFPIRAAFPIVLGVGIRIFTFEACSDLLTLRPATSLERPSSLCHEASSRSHVKLRSILAMTSARDELKHTFRLPPDISSQLDDYAARKRVPKAPVVEPALASLFSPTAPTGWKPHSAAASTGSIVRWSDWNATPRSQTRCSRYSSAFG